MSSRLKIWREREKEWSTKTEKIMIKLGQVGKDVVTGFQGICIGKAQYLTGCNQVYLVPQKLSKEGKRQDGEWFDDQRIQAQGEKVLELDNEKSPGMDEREPPKR